MQQLTTAHFCGALCALFLVAAAGVYSGRKVKNASDFATGGGKLSALMIIGSVVGTSIGGGSTIGTAENAFKLGISAWAFCLGTGIGGLIHASVLVGAFRKRGAATIPEIISEEYGPAAGLTTCCLSALGMFGNLVAQILAGSVLLHSVFFLPLLPAVLISVGLMAFFVLFGGMWGAGMVGILKAGLLFAGMSLCAVLVLSLSGGPAAFISSFPAEPYFNFIPSGAAPHLGALLGTVFGILSTQVYLQAAVSGKTEAAARRGLFLGGLLAPVVGLFSVMVGMYMASNFPSMPAANAFPQFLFLHMSPFLCGLLLATLLITIIGSGAGIALGISTTLTNNLYCKVISASADSRKALLVSRATILLCLAIAAVLAVAGSGASILSWTILSMSLRACVLLVPMLCALFLPGRISLPFILAGIAAAPALSILGHTVLPLPGDPLFWGLAAAAVLACAGGLHQIRFPRAESLSPAPGGPPPSDLQP